MRIQLNKDEILEIQPEGTGQCTAADGHGYPIYVEFYEGMWAVYLWEDINKEDYTDVISLERAVETAQRQTTSLSIDEQRKATEILADVSIPTGTPIDALERIRDYAWLIMNDAAPDQNELDPGWIWAIARQGIRRMEEDKA